MYNPDPINRPPNRREKEWSVFERWLDSQDPDGIIPFIWSRSDLEFLKFLRVKP